MQEAEKEKVYTEQLINETNHNVNELRAEVAKLEVQVENDEAAVISAKNYIEQYKSSFIWKKSIKGRRYDEANEGSCRNGEKDLQQKCEEKNS